jgi:hypothetical protein
MLHIKKSMPAQMTAISPDIHRLPRFISRVGRRKLVDSPSPNGTATSNLSRDLGRLVILEAVSFPPLDRDTTAGLAEEL